MVEKHCITLYYFVIWYIKAAVSIVLTSVLIGHFYFLAIKVNPFRSVCNDIQWSERDSQIYVENVSQNHYMVKTIGKTI